MSASATAISTTFVWIIGGDRNPDEAREEVDAVAQGIKETDDRHLMTAHCHPENSAIDQYRNEGWLDLNDTYTYGIVHQKLLADLRPAARHALRA